MTLADIGVLAILAVSALFAFWRGLARELLSIGAWVGAGVATYFGLPLLRPFARRYIELDIIADVVTGMVIFLVVLVIGSIISHFVARGVRGSALGPLDRSLGLLFGLARGALLVCLAFLLLDWAKPAEQRPAWIAEAKTLPLVTSGADLLKTMLPNGATAKGAQSLSTATKQVEQAIELGKATRVLNGTAPAIEMIAPRMVQNGRRADAGESPPESAGPPADSGYNDAERRDLNRLIQGTQ